MNVFKVNRYPYFELMKVKLEPGPAAGCLLAAGGVANV